MATLLITVFVVGSFWFVSGHPTAVPLCFHPTVSVSEAETAAAQTVGRSATAFVERTVCPASEQKVGALATGPTSQDIEIVAGLGLVGAALSAAVSIKNLSGKVTPYDIPVAVALLKLPIGALTAVIGILLLGGGFIPGLSNLDSQRQILAYALVLGFAQQLVTQLIDRRASDLIAQVPSRHSKTPPTASLPAPPASSVPSQRAATGDSRTGSPALNGTNGSAH